MRIGAVVDQPSSALRPTWFGMSAFAGWMLIVPSAVPEKYRSFGNGNTPWAGWNITAVAAVVVAGVPPGTPLPVRGSVAVTSGGFPAELEQPATTIIARTAVATAGRAAMRLTAAESLFMSSLLG